MKYVSLTVLLSIMLVAVGCSGSTTKVPAKKAEPPATATPKGPQDGFYTTTGVVTKINEQLGSIELDHEAIPDLMPAMKMEFSLKDKKMIKNVVVGDKAKFTIEYKQGTEIIVAIAKSE